MIFERHAQAGYPEVLFNLFPGMGAWHLTIGKGGFGIANDMILSGQIYTADQLHRAGLVDLVVDAGLGMPRLSKIVRSAHPRLRGILTALQARRLASPIAYESLQTVVESGRLARYD